MRRWAISSSCERNIVYLTETLKPGIDQASSWMKVISEIRFQNGEVSSILKICSGKQFSAAVSLSRVSKKLTETSLRGA
jgi:hypothetical protein